MKINAQITQVGSSIYVLIPANIRNKLNISIGDEVELDILKINKNNVLKSYKCRVCSYCFDSDEDTPFCPACSDSSIQEIKEEDVNNDI